MGEFVKLLVLAGLAVACFTAPRWVPAVVGTSVSAPAELRRDEEVPCSDECVQSEDEWCSGATPDYECHDEAWY